VESRSLWQKPSASGFERMSCTQRGILLEFWGLEILVRTCCASRQLAVQKLDIFD
jgi:hypothetical protein